MSLEQRYTVFVPVAETERISALQRSAAAALERQSRAPIGDLADGLRYEQIQSEIDRIAFSLLAVDPTGDHVARSEMRLQVTWPFASGSTPGIDSTGEPVESRRAWRPSDQRADRRSAVKARFEEQLERWTYPVPGHGTPPEPVCPSDISNSVLSEGLRAYFEATEDSSPARARVVYRDGSEARALPLRSVHFEPATSDNPRTVLKLTLLSVRHMEMDATVDGAWLRNREISLARPSGQTDELVYRYSRDQLADLAAREPIEIHMFQTGLEPAIVGFYRALADHHLHARGKPVSVFPQYYAGGSDFAPGTPWVIRP
jgi:hypothetical protein